MNNTEHLTVEEMIDFVSINKLDEKSVSLAAKVNAHMMQCSECRKTVAAYQTVYDEFVRMGRNGLFVDAEQNGKTVAESGNETRERSGGEYLER